MGVTLSQLKGNLGTGQFHTEIKGMTTIVFNAQRWKKAKGIIARMMTVSIKDMQTLVTDQDPVTRVFDGLR